MNNKERYKQAFSVLHASRAISLEETSMNTKVARQALRPAFVVAISVAAVFGCMATAYAADLGGIQEMVRVWFNGQAVEAQLTLDPESEVGAYELHIPANDGSGEEQVISGGGIAIDADGTERPVTIEEVVEELSSEVDRDEEGNIWLYESGQSYNITDLMAEGSCKVVVSGEDGSLHYYEIEDNGGGGYAYSRSPKPESPLEEYVEL